MFSVVHYYSLPQIIRPSAIPGYKNRQFSQGLTIFLSFNLFFSLIFNNFDGRFDPFNSISGTNLPGFHVFSIFFLFHGNQHWMNIIWHLRMYISVTLILVLYCCQRYSVWSFDYYNELYRLDLLLRPSFWWKRHLKKSSNWNYTWVEIVLFGSLFHHYDKLNLVF